MHRHSHTREQRERLQRFLHGARVGNFEGGFRRPKYNVPVNIEDKGDSYEMTVYCVGFDKENVKLSVKDDVLYVTGKKEVAENFKPEFVKQEFPVKIFERTLAFNGKVDAAAISAKHENGVLIITLPKTEEAKTSTKEIVVE